MDQEICKFKYVWRIFNAADTKCTRKKVLNKYQQKRDGAKVKNRDIEKTERFIATFHQQESKHAFELFILFILLVRL